VSGRCCPKVQTVVLCLHVITITRPHLDGVALSFGWMQNVCRQFPYQGSRHLDSVALTSGRVQDVFPLCACEGKLESSQTLKSVRMCCHDVRTDVTLNCLKLLNKDGRPDGNMEYDFTEFECVSILYWQHSG
jgi:hypothetical protein